MIPERLQPPQLETLEPPKPVQAVPKEQAAGMIRLNEMTVSLLDDRVDDFVTGVLNEPSQSEAFQKR